MQAPDIGGGDQQQEGIHGVRSFHPVLRFSDQCAKRMENTPQWNCLDSVHSGSSSVRLSPQTAVNLGHREGCHCVSWIRQHSFSGRGVIRRLVEDFPFQLFCYASLVYSLLDGLPFIAIIPKILGKAGQGNSTLELPMKLITWENETKFM